MDPRRVCPTCEYDLRGLPVPRCPECGRQFSAEEWGDPTVLVPMPAWERLPWVNVIYAFPTTILMVLARPRRSLRLLRVDDHLLRVVTFLVLLVPAAWVIAALFSFFAVTLGYCFKELIPNFAYWEGHLWAFDGKWKWVVLNGIRVAIHCTAFLCATLALWLPALVTLDLVFWRNRRPFRLFAKALLYNMAWACVFGAFAATLGRAVMEQLDMEWAWDPAGRSFVSDGVMPWVCWVALVIVTVQCGMLLWFVRSPRCAFRFSGPPVVRVTSIVIGGTWLLAAYVMLLDRHVHLRFHLQFIGEELWNWYGPLFRGC